jgi:hypothetical protein
MKRNKEMMKAASVLKRANSNFEGTLVSLGIFWLCEI